MAQRGDSGGGEDWSHEENTRDSSDPKTWDTNTNGQQPTTQSGDDSIGTYPEIAAPPPYISIVGDPTGHKSISPKESFQNDDFWTVRELLWGVVIIVIAIIVLLVVGYLISYHLPQEKPK